MTNIKVKSTVYPPEQISENQWMKEFNVGKRYLYGPAVAFGEFISVLKENYRSKKGKMPILSGKNI